MIYPSVRFQSFLNLFLLLSLAAFTPSNAQQATYPAPYQTKDPVVTIVPSQTVGSNLPRFDNTRQQRIFDSLVDTYSLNGSNSSSDRVVRLVDTLLSQIHAAVDTPTGKVLATTDNLIGADGCEPGPALLIHTAVWHVGPAGLGDGTTPRTFSLAHSEWHGFQWKRRYANLFGPCEFVASQRSDGSPSFLGARSIYFLAVNAFDSPLYGSRVSVDYKLSELALLPANLADLATALSAVTGIQLASPSASTNQSSAPTPITNGSDGSGGTSPITLIVSLSQTVVPSSPVTARSLIPTSIAPYSISASFFLQFQPSPIVVTEGQKLAKPPTNNASSNSGQQTGGAAQSDTSIYLPNYLEQLLSGTNPIGLGPLPIGLIFQSDLEVALANYAAPTTTGQTPAPTISGQKSDPAKEHLAALTAAVATEKFEQYTLLAATEAAQPVQTLMSLYYLPRAALIQQKSPKPGSVHEAAPSPDQPAVAVALGSTTLSCPGPDPSNDPDIHFDHSALNQYLCTIRTSAYLTGVKLDAPVKQALTDAGRSADEAQSASEAAKDAATTAATNVETLTGQLQRDADAISVAQVNATAAQLTVDQETALQEALNASLETEFQHLLTLLPAGTTPPSKPGQVTCIVQPNPPQPPADAAALQPAAPVVKSPLEVATDSFCQVRQKLDLLQTQLTGDQQIVTDADKALDTAQKKQVDDNDLLTAANTKEFEAQAALTRAQQNAQTTATYSTTLQGIDKPVTEAEKFSAQSDLLLQDSEKRAQCIVTELHMVRHQTAPTPADIAACPNLKTVQTILPQLTPNLSEKARDYLAQPIQADIEQALKYTDSHLREIDGYAVLVNRAVNTATQQEQTAASADTKPAPPKTSPTACCCCQNTSFSGTTHTNVTSTSASTTPTATGALTSEDAAASAPAATVPANPDPAPARGTITGISFRDGDFPLLLALHSPAPPYIPVAHPIPPPNSVAVSAPLPPRPEALKNSCVLPTEVPYQPGDNPCVQFIALTSVAGSAPSTSAGAQGGNQGGGGKNQANPTGAAGSTISLSPSQPVDCSRQSSASPPCAFSRAFTVDEPEWWDISLGLAIPGVREKTYTIASTASAMTPTPPAIPYGKGPIPCPIGYNCANKHHADAMVFVDFYPFARAWEKGRRPLWTNESYVPHIAIGVPITSQTLYRPFFGLSEHWTAKLEQYGLPLGVSFYGGMVWMKQLTCTQFCIDSPTPPMIRPEVPMSPNLFYNRVWRPSFGVEISVSAISGKLTKGGGGGAGAGSASKASASGSGVGGPPK